MKKQVIPVCPVCKHELIITSVHCDRCDISISGQFTLSKFDYLNQEQLRFVDIFIKNQGNIKSIEKEMNISYPTVKKLLADVIIALGHENVMNEEISQEQTKQTAEIKSDILSRVANKSITVDEAIHLLKQNK